jgi:membrane associated rhomboid family serine protease
VLPRSLPLAQGPTRRHRRGEEESRRLFFFFFPLLGPSAGATLVASGACAGLLAAVLTQPLDTVKTRMQAYMEQPEYRFAPEAAREMAKAPCGAARALFAGLLPRGVRIVGATMILQAVRTALLGMIAARGVEVGVGAEEERE